MGTLTSLQWLSFTRNLMEGSWDTLDPSTLFGGLCIGKGCRKSSVRPKLHFLSPSSPGSTSK